MDERLEELFPFYALGVLSDEERAQVDAYVASEPTARARLDEAIRTVAAVPFGMPAIAPQSQVKAALMTRITVDARANAHTPARFVLTPSFFDKLTQFFNLPPLRVAVPLVATVSLVLAVALGVWAISLNNEVARLRNEEAALQQELAASRETLAQVASPTAQTIAISGTQVQPAAHGKMIVDPASNSAVLIVSDLKPLPLEQTYQFWLIRGNVPVSAGLFTVDAQGHGTLQVKSSEAIGSFDAIGVSIEPAGGSQQPTGDIVMLSKLS